MPAPGQTAEKGRAAEDIAARFLERQNLKIIERNFRVRGGEIDLICDDGRSIVFVEVRLRSSSKFGGAAASISSSKQQRLILAAQHWLLRHKEFPHRDCRFDCILMDAPDEAHIEWIRNAFGSD